MARRKIKDCVWDISYDIEVAYDGRKGTDFLEGWQCTILSTNDLEDAFTKVKKHELGHVFEADADNDCPEGTIVGVRFTSASIKDTLSFL